MRKSTLFLLFLSLFLAQEAKSQSYYFPPLTGNTWDTLSPQSLHWCQFKIDQMYAYLNANNTKAFIVLKDGKIVLEKYFDTFTADSIWAWNSAGKSLTAFLVGMAQEDSLFSIADTSADYLGAGWTNCTTQQEEKITIRHQLTMTTGLDDGVPDDNCFSPSCLLYKADAGTRWAYHTAPYTLLHQIIENTSGQNINAYVNQKLKTPTGMTGLFYIGGYNHVYYSNARSMARFGSLILNKGKWNNTVLLADTNYFHAMVNTSQSLNLSYGYLWWLNGKSSFMAPASQSVYPISLAPNAPSDMIAAIGKDGQFVNVVPSQKLVLIRMGEAPTNSLVPFLLNDSIWRYMSNLTCQAGLDEYSQFTPCNIYPNPFNQELHLNNGNVILQSARIIDLQGKLLFQQAVNNYTTTLQLGFLPHGIYLLETTAENGEIWRTKIIKP